MGQVTLRLLKPECALDPEWGAEDLGVATQRTVQLLHTHTVPQRENKAGECTCGCLNAHGLGMLGADQRRKFVTKNTNEA